jgi:pre-mRNA-splicing factor CWC22
MSPQGLHSIFERFRGILHEGEIDKRVQFMIESLFALRKAGFEGQQGIPKQLDLVEADDQITHEISLEDELVAETGLDIFKVDAEVSISPCSCQSHSTIVVERFKADACCDRNRTPTATT